jgi:hypothetical protein
VGESPGGVFEQEEQFGAQGGAEGGAYNGPAAVDLAYLVAPAAAENAVELEAGRIGNGLEEEMRVDVEAIDADVDGKGQVYLPLLRGEIRRLPVLFLLLEDSAVI